VWAKDKLDNIMLGDGCWESRKERLVQLLVATCRGLITAKNSKGMTPLQFLLELGAHNERKQDTEC